MTDRKDRLKVVVDGEKVNKLLVVNRLGHRVEGSVAELLHLLLRKTSFETLSFICQKKRKENLHDLRECFAFLSEDLGEDLLVDVASVVNIEGLRLSSETYNSLGFDEGAHARTHQHMRATHTSDLHKCPHSPGMPPRDLRERQARTSLEG